jgi:hypothetical protein
MGFITCFGQVEGGGKDIEVLEGVEMDTVVCWGISVDCAAAWQ